MRYKLTLAYRGTNYFGWQRQMAVPGFRGQMPAEGEGLPTIQEVTSRAFGHVLGHPVEIVGASRTDARVHAKGQVAHLDTHRREIPIEGLMAAVNHRLPSDVLVRRIQRVDDDFHAIRSTTSKRYQYFIWNSLQRPLFFYDLAWHRWQLLDIAAMRQAAALLVGEHDFASFARAGHGRRTTVRTLLDCSVSRRGGCVVVGVEGTGFLWNMVRIIVGTLVLVGRGRRTPAEVGQMLAAADRRVAGPTAPPHGLFLQWVKSRDIDPGETP